VRTHVGADAARLAASVGAQAYTVGNHIVFGSGNSPSDRPLLAHELAHVLQQVSAPPVLLRQPLKVKLDPRVDRSPPDPGIPQWTPADRVLELHRLPGEKWEITLSGVTSVESAGAALWLKGIPRDLVPISLKVAITDPIERGWFVIEGLEARHLQYMEPTIAALFRDRGLVEQETAELAKARDAFRKHDSDRWRLPWNHPLGEWNYHAIDVALKRATRGNPDLMIAYYLYYSTHDFDRDKDLKDIGSTSSGETTIRSKVLMLEPKEATSDPLSLLGSTLIHEFVHTPQGPKEIGGQVTEIRKEAKAYGVELLFAERMGDTKRADDIKKQWYGNDSLIISTGANKVFDRTYNIISALYEIIDNQGGDAAAAARRMSVEFISKNEADYGPELRSFISNNVR
jgi:Domain of unknown function (DUF4157)